MPNKKEDNELSRNKIGNNAQENEKEDRKTFKWQERLLPTMSSLLIGLTIFFFIATFFQMSYLHWNIIRQPELNIRSTELTSSDDIFIDPVKARELEVKSELEAYIVTRRYKHQSALIMSGLWFRYLGFVTGMILALIGASFVLGKLREPSQKIEGKFSIVDFSIYTASPGIILVVLGTILMFTTIIDKDEYTIKDSAVYVVPSIFSPALDDTMETPTPYLNPSDDTMETPTPRP